MLSLLVALLPYAYANDIEVGDAATIVFAGNVASAPAQPLNLEGGLYRFTVLSGTNEAANPWGGLVSGCNGAGSGCSQGWTTAYRISAGVDGVTFVSSGLFQTPALAVAAAEPVDVCLSETQSLQLTNNDVNGGFLNNTGGLNIDIQRLSEAGNCDEPFDWVIVNANQSFGSDVLVESSPSARLRPSTIRARLDALETEATDLGCDSFADTEWAGSYGNGIFEGVTEDDEVVSGSYAGRQLSGSVDTTAAGDLFGSHRGGRALLNVGPATNAGAGYYVRVQGGRGVWVGGEVTCPSDVSTLLGPWQTGD